MMEVFCAVGGALGVRLLEIVEISKLPATQRPDLKDRWFWVPWVVGILLAAFLAGVYEISRIDLTPIVAVNVGASAPLIFRTFASAIPVAKPNLPAGA